MNSISVLKNYPNRTLSKNMKKNQIRPGSIKRIRFFNFWEKMWKNCYLTLEKKGKKYSFQQGKKQNSVSPQKRVEIKYLSKTQSPLIHKYLKNIYFLNSFK